MLSQFSRRRRHLRPLQQRPAACWAPHWPWPRGCCWCWGPPWSPSSSCMCRGRQSCGQRRQSWRQLGPRCCWILMSLPTTPARSPCPQPLPAVTGWPLPAPLADPVAGSQSPAKSPAAAQRQKEQLDLLLLGGAQGLGGRGGRLPLLALPPGLHHQPRGAGLPGAGGEGKTLLDRADGHGPGGLLALGGRGCLLPGPELLGAGAAGQHRPREVGAGGLRPDPPRGQRPLERP
ncbi:uncharacterized protein LOC141942351 isoform X3 [Strix uralensis]|uniref:uncharacterized protein LOC141942351 isoform X3 n=1 Tax=Strix uralensis TaxID=36305 RepID=UPI003DA726B2